ncbi:MAG TPA: prepilin-type N-terminal cleavage/methylation domain-containing protein [Gammaproteobacteria bacterium]|jgi:prepilin-type N-terminal cleavage/methylation domain-containing protein|nr:prepilin-type N-terminal cleavage/methylation domain-containing protein [Gammaproteobacteria bacterium]
MRFHCGFTLLEVLFTLFIFSLFLTGITASQSQILRQVRGEYYYQQALLQAFNMRNYSLANHGNITGYVVRWRENIKNVLPDGEGIVRQESLGDHIVVKWGKAEALSCQHSKAGISGCVVLAV